MNVSFLSKATRMFCLILERILPIFPRFLPPVVNTNLTAVYTVPTGNVGAVGTAPIFPTTALV